MLPPTMRARPRVETPTGAGANASAPPTGRSAHGSERSRVGVPTGRSAGSDALAHGCERAYDGWSASGCERRRERAPTGARSYAEGSKRRVRKQQKPTGASAHGRVRELTGGADGCERRLEERKFNGSAAPRKARQHQPAHVPPGHAH